MKNLKQFIQKTKNQFQRKLNDISGKIKIRAYVIFILALTAIACTRMVKILIFSIFCLKNLKLINLNPDYISSITEKNSDFLTNRETFEIFSAEIISSFEIKLSNIIMTVDIICRLLTKSFDDGIF